jgi:hypothetical protein
MRFFMSTVIALALTGCGASRSHGASQADTTRNPSVFLTVDGGSFSLDVRSVQTGSVVRTLADDVGGDPALSPDGSVAYYQSGSVHAPPRIVSVPVTGGTPVPIAPGSAPAVSPDSAKLAFAFPGLTNVVGVYDAASRTIQRVDLTRLIGPRYHLEDSGSLLAWVSDKLLVVIPSGDATTFASDRSAGARSSEHSAGTEYPPQKAVVIDLAHVNSAQQFDISLPGGFVGVGGPGPSPVILLIGTENAIDRFMVTPTSITSVGTAPIPTDALVQALSPDGLKVLYLVSGGPSSPPPTAPADGATSSAPPAPYQSGIQLWEATIGKTLNSPRLVFGNAQLYGAAW